MKKFSAYYDKSRFGYIHEALMSSGIVKQYNNVTIVNKTACFYSKDVCIYIDTSDGVNEDLGINEYCGRINRVVEDADGRKFIYFKAAYSNLWTENIVQIANKNNGVVLPFFKWSFNNQFFDYVYNNRSNIIKEYNGLEKEYDIGYFCDTKLYKYPLPSEVNNLISHEDHVKFNIPGKSRNTGYIKNNSRKNIYNKISNSKFKVLYPGKKISYEEYIKNSFKCNVILNPPGVGEYTSRMFDQCYLGNCLIMRKNSYDNALSWKNYIKEIDFDNNWEEDIDEVIKNLDFHKSKCKEYFDKFWTPESIVNFMISKIEEA